MALSWGYDSPSPTWPVALLADSDVGQQKGHDWGGQFAVTLRGSVAAPLQDFCSCSPLFVKSVGALGAILRISATRMT